MSPNFKLIGCADFVETTIDSSTLPEVIRIFQYHRDVVLSPAFYNIEEHNKNCAGAISCAISNMFNFKNSDYVASIRIITTFSDDQKSVMHSITCGDQMFVLSEQISRKKW